MGKSKIRAHFALKHLPKMDRYGRRPTVLCKLFYHLEVHNFFFRSLMDRLKSLKTNQVDLANEDLSKRHPETISSEISSPDLSRDQERRERQQSNIILQDHLIGKLSNQVKGLEEKQEVVKQGLDIFLL
jgi:hypothetical protein